jgi:[protein-PII] uridylyltransferase
VAHSARTAAPAVSPAFGSATTALRQQLQNDRMVLRQRFLSNPDTALLLRQTRRLVDRTLRDVWRRHHVPQSLALVAVGGYGRGELFPHSDVDILLLLPAPPDDALRVQLEALIGNLWDIGIEVAHSVRTLDECVAESAKDVTVQTSLLESRLIVGGRKLFQSFQAATRAAFDPKAFFKAKRLEQEQRHAKYQDTAYSLEPNFKEAPGGMRDLQIILWIARSGGIGQSWKDLAVRGLITHPEARQLKRHQSLLEEIRARLHFLAGRREDRLLFDYQDALARQFGYAPTTAKRASEQFMQRYYRTAKAITQLNTILLQNLGVALVPLENSTPIPINERFQVVQELLDARDASLFEREPGAILESFLLIQKHPELKGMTASTLRALWRGRLKIDAKFRRSTTNRARFIEFFQQPRGIVHGLRRMNQYSILGTYIPAFGKIVGQMQHDLFHVYTVDQHILTVVRNMRRFTMLEFAHEYPLCSRLIAGFERHWILYIAALFHDIAKGRGGDHSKLGKVDARLFCRQHGLSKEDTQLIEFLVENHLNMSAVAQKQDLSDPDTIEAFAKLVKSERQLTALYLLTVADVRGTSPKVWNAWKGKLLEDLFNATLRALHGGRLSNDQGLQERQSEAMRLLRLYALSDTVKDEFWKQLDVPYFLRHDAQDIAWQTRTLHYRVNAADPVVKARLSPIGEGLQVMVYVKDQKDLFARICGYFGEINFNIADAKVHTTRHGYALDTFLVLGPGKSPHYRDMINLIEDELRRRIGHQSSLPPPGRARLSRQLKHFPISPEVHIRADEKGQYHLLSITAGDRPGLLYGVARILSKYEIDLRTARINTLGERAEDVFVLSGAALSNPRAVLLLEQDLLEQLQS